MRQTIHHFCPDLPARLELIVDPRERREYSMTEILMGAIFLYICKEDSRNAFNNDRAKDAFKANYETLFGKRLPHMDTVDTVLRGVNNDEIERLKAGVMSVNKGHCLHCLHTTSSKSGTVTYFHNLLEAKLIMPNGFAISLASEWIENPADYDKQDCEQKAFKRLAERLKSFFPRLRICIHADGLYPNAPFFEICQANDWRYIVTLRDGSLKSLWEVISSLTHAIIDPIEVLGACSRRIQIRYQ